MWVVGAQRAAPKTATHYLFLNRRRGSVPFALRCEFAAWSDVGRSTLRPYARGVAALRCWRGSSLRFAPPGLNSYAVSRLGLFRGTGGCGGPPLQDQRISGTACRAPTRRSLGLYPRFLVNHQRLIALDVFEGLLGSIGPCNFDGIHRRVAAQAECQRQLALRTVAGAGVHHA